MSILLESLGFASSIPTEQVELVMDHLNKEKETKKLKQAKQLQKL